MNERTAVVLFARDPRLEAAQKRLVGRRSVAVHAALLAAAAERLKIDGMDLVFAWQGDPDKAWVLKPRAVVRQRGRSFGERMRNALLDVVELGYERLVVVGTDCPAIDATVVTGALRQLGARDVVVGPATDGGVNLIACSRGALEKVDLRPLPWLTSSLFSAVERALANAGCRVGLLPETEDIDTTETLGRFMRSAPDSLLARLVERALSPGPPLEAGEEHSDRTPLTLFGPAFLKSPPEETA